MKKNYLKNKRLSIIVFFLITILPLSILYFKHKQDDYLKKQMVNEEKENCHDKRGILIKGDKNLHVCVKSASIIYVKKHE